MAFSLAFLRAGRAAQTVKVETAPMPRYLELVAQQTEQRPEKLPTSAIDVPALLFQLSIEANLPADKRLEFARVMVQGAADDSTNAEAAIVWFAGLKEVLNSLKAVQTHEIVQNIRWRAFEMALRAGLPMEATAYATEALEYGAFPSHLVDKLSTWPPTVETIDCLVALLPRLAGAQAQSKVKAALDALRQEYLNA